MATPKADGLAAKQSNPVNSSDKTNASASTTSKPAQDNPRKRKIASSNAGNAVSSNSRSNNPSRAPYSTATASTNPQAAKRARTNSARIIATQSNNNALNRNGDLDAAAFVAARQYEVAALQAAMAASKGAATKRAFQSVPRELRRRTASHNVKKVPSRLRARAKREVCIPQIFRYA